MKKDEIVSGASFWLKIIFVPLLFMYLLGNIGGDMWGWMFNQTCFPILSCNDGFFGFDGLMHVVSGALLVLALIWHKAKHPESSILRDRFWSNVLIILGVVALIAVLWEIDEFCFDHIRIYWFHMNLTNPNRLSQANNGDTMGDLTLELIGAAVTIFLARWANKKLV